MPLNTYFVTLALRFHSFQTIRWSWSTILEWGFRLRAKLETWHSFRTFLWTLIENRKFGWGHQPWTTCGCHSTLLRTKKNLRTGRTDKVEERRTHQFRLRSQNRRTATFGTERESGGIWPRNIASRLIESGRRCLEVRVESSLNLGTIFTQWDNVVLPNLCQKLLCTLPIRSNNAGGCGVDDASVRSRIVMSPR